MFHKKNGQFQIVIGIVFIVILLVGVLLASRQLLRPMDTTTPSSNSATQNFAVQPTTPSTGNNSNAQLDQDLNGLNSQINSVSQEQTAINQGLNQTAPNLEP